MSTGILKRLRIPGRLGDPDIKDLSLVKRAANKEKVIMAKKQGDDEDEGYDFSEIEDSTKNALALSYEAIKSADVMDSLPEEVGEFYKSAAKELKLDEKIEIRKAEQDNEDEKDEEKKKERIKKAEEAEAIKKTEMIKTALPGALEAAQKLVVEPLQVEIKKAQEEITTLQSKLQRDEMRIFAKSMIPGDDAPTDEQVDELITIKKSMDDKGWESYVKNQRGLVVQIEKSALFERQSNPAASTPGSAYEQLESISKSIVEKSEDKDPGKAWDHAVETNPTLYNQYRKEQAAQAKVGVSA